MFLPDGDAASMRDRARRELRCPVRDCPKPDITTVDRSAVGYRSGFRHLHGGVTHEPESFAHIQAKAAVLAWARTHPGVGSAWCEVDLGPRRPDVLLELRDGSALAVEMQYSGLTLLNWRDRTASYRALGLDVVWLWGHLGKFAPRRSEGLHLSLHQGEQARNLQPILWINPERMELGWAVGQSGWLPLVLPGRTDFETVALDQVLTVSGAGIFPATWAERLKATEGELARRASRSAAKVQRGPAPASTTSWPRRTPPEPKIMSDDFGRVLICDVCKFPIEPGQQFRNGRHEVCAYLL
ncbi:MAG: hypothetical protein NVS3B21_15320 [Acidimicrobiales bacterium]